MDREMCGKRINSGQSGDNVNKAQSANWTLELTKPTKPKGSGQHIAMENVYQEILNVMDFVNGTSVKKTTKHVQTY